MAIARSSLRKWPCAIPRHEPPFCGTGFQPVLMARELPVLSIRKHPARVENPCHNRRATAHDRGRPFTEPTQRIRNGTTTICPAASGASKIGRRWAMRRTALIALIILLAGGAVAALVWHLARPDHPSDELALYGNVDLRQVDLAFNNN